ncbi:unnamed protein product, partial [Meganyctiphanes norvegica]
MAFLCIPRTIPICVRRPVAGLSSFVVGYQGRSYNRYPTHNYILQLSSQSRHRRILSFRRQFNTSESQDVTLDKLRLMKRIFAFSLFTGTLVLAWSLKKRKGERLKELLEDCQRLHIDEDLYKGKMSMYRYKGYVFPGKLILSGVFKELPQFEFRPDDILVASYPKTGTTWVQEIVYMLTHNCNVTEDDSETLETRFPYLEYPYPGIKHITAKTGPRFIKTHLPLSLLPDSFASSGSKCVYVTRNPRDTAVSYFHFLRMVTEFNFLGTFKDFAKLFKTDAVPYSPFYNHVQEYWEARKDPNILFITYEDLQNKPTDVIREIAEFLGLSVTEEDIRLVAYSTSFNKMASNPSTNYEHWKDIGFIDKDRGAFMRKGKIGDWKNHFSDRDLIEFQDWENSNQNNLNFKFQFMENKEAQMQES